VGLEAPLGPSLSDGRLRRMDPRHVPCARLGGAVFALLLALAGGAGYAYLAFATQASRAALVWIACLGGAGLALVALSAWFYPPLELRYSAWRLSSFGLEIRRGVWFRHAQSVPRARVQHADVKRGPLQRRFDLATLVVYTAGHQHGEIHLHGLPHGTALSIRDFLLAEAGDDGA
jgi:membrane protein YdbS with pleckstrin-like domain